MNKFEANYLSPLARDNHREIIYANNLIEATIKAESKLRPAQSVVIFDK